ncbi:MAG: hypothetical protein QOF43_1997 [Gaiellaceae bacterium]|nr:hypothetical protein [Gaiellaceae bacterium]
MSSSATPRQRRAGARFANLVLDAAPLTSIYVWLCIVYAVEAWKRVTPWLFTEELEMTQISRSIAATGHSARRGEPYPFHSLYPVMTAAVWLIDNVATAYSGIKYLDVFVMTAVVFPTYLLARLVVGKRAALFAAFGAAAIPSLAYSSYIVEETLAYPFSALCLYLIAKALYVRGQRNQRAWLAAAVAASIVAPGVRRELVVIPIVFFLSALFLIWSSDWARERQARWSRSDWAGVVVLGLGVVFAFSAYATHHSFEWLAVTRAYKDRLFVLGDWAVGAFAIGVGVLPLVAGLAGLFPVRREAKSRALRVFRCVAAATLLGFGLYTGMKAAYLSTVFATRIEERNVIYIAPVLFVAMAIVLERRRVNLYALGAAAAYVGYLIVGTPFRMDIQLYSDALGLAILQQANRFYELGPTTAQWSLLAILVAGSILLAAINVLPRTVATGVAAALAVGVLAWNVTAEIAAGAGTISVASELEATLHHPFTWVDDVAHRKPTIYLAQGVADQNPEWMLEFWNRSIVTVDSLDATLGGPGPSGAPNVATDGRLYWSSDPDNPGRQYDFGVEDWPCVDFAGRDRGHHFYKGGADKPSQWRLIQLARPNRLRAECSGIYPDGWTGANDSQYFRFTGSKSGWLRISLARSNWPATPVVIKVGTIGSEDKQPKLARVTKTLRINVGSSNQTVYWLRTPPSSFAAKVVVVEKFVPRDVNPRLTDPRILGVLIDYRYFAKRPPGT